MRILLLLSHLLFVAVTCAQVPQTSVDTWLRNNRERLGLTPLDIRDPRITDATVDRNGVQHVHIRQHLHGLDVHGGVGNFTLKHGEVVHFGDRLVRRLEEHANGPVPALDALQALAAALEQLGTPSADLALRSSTDAHHHELEAPVITTHAIPAELIYQALPNGQAVLAWHLTIRTASNWWRVAVDAQNGRIVRKNDLVVHCSFPASPFGRATVDHTPEEAAPAPLPAPRPQDGSGYRVFPFPTESPSHGPHTLVTDPADPTASPYGWHDTNGSPGAEYTITRGNNVFAYEDHADNDDPGHSPDGGSTLLFDFPYSPQMAPAQYLDAAITNLFHTCNVLHDVWYHYGFDEVSGNFQHRNYSGDGQGLDAVIAQAQDGGGTNNANFATPPDGEPGVMQMYLWRVSNDSTLTVNSPASIMGNYTNSLAGFGPELPQVPLTADVVLVVDNTAPVNDGCGSLLNVGAIFGNIALVDRGNCTFVAKVELLEAAGAVAVIVVNNQPGAPITMGGTGGEDISIPSVMISQSDGELIKNALANGTVNATLASMAHATMRDSDLDNGIIAHEYGHGVSNRLTGGPSNSDCLWNDEQMGEGWSDWMGMMLTIRPDDVPATLRGVGTYVKDEDNDGPGIRPAPYTTDLSVNGYTYGSTNDPNLTQPHGVGFVWASMLWDLTWAMVDEHGYDPDLYQGSGGNNMAIRLMMDGLKVQPCNPGFVDGRDAILLADELNYNGANTCLIWRTFARRGLGASASQGSSFSRSDQTEAFDIPTACMSVGLPAITAPTEASIHLRPNPADGSTLLQLSRGLEQEATVRLITVEGRVHRTLRLATGRTSLQLDLAGVSPGVYLVQVTTADRTWQERLVVR